MKMKAASEVGVTLNQGDNGHLTARQAGSIGGQMVKNMLQSYGSSTTKTTASTKSTASNSTSGTHSNGRVGSRTKKSTSTAKPKTSKSTPKSKTSNSTSKKSK